MEASTKVIGCLIRNTAMVVISMQMAITIKATGSTVKCKAKGNIFTLAVPVMMETGSKMCITASVMKSGRMALYTKATFSMVRSRVKESSSGRMEALSLENSMITRWKDKGFTSGQTADVTLANGETRKCTATESSHLRTEENTEVSI